MEIKPIHKATCHCGAVELEIALSNGIVNPRRCNCSICRRRGSITATATLDTLKVVNGEEFLTLLSIQHDDGEALFLFAMWNLHPPSTALRPQ